MRKFNNDLFNASSPKSLPDFPGPIEAFERLGGRLGLNGFMKELPLVIQQLIESHDSVTPQDVMQDPIADLFFRLQLSGKEISQYSHFETSKKYTRNLISTDDKTYTLLLLCWNPGKESPIHDHPCDGCWIRVCQGSIQECRYKKKDEDNDELECISDEIFDEGKVAYIRDSMGYHKVGNPSKNQKAITLHLYCPPFEECRIWLDKSEASKPSYCSVCYHSRFGELLRRASSKD